MIKEEYKEIIKAAVAGGEVVSKYFGKTLEIEGKSMPCDFRTKADLESEKAILKILQKKFPKYNINSEETGKINKNSEYTFVIDPLDGTNNFVLGIPNFSIAVALMKGGETIFGVVFNPILKNMYFAEKGKGAFLNKKRIKVNKEFDIKNSSVSLVVNYGFSVDNFIKIIEGLYKLDIKRVLTNWSLALDFCLLASGRIEALVMHVLPIYDFAAGKIIAQEAGALITNFRGLPLKSDENNIFLITNGTKIHKKILKILNK